MEIATAENNGVQKFTTEELLEALKNMNANYVKVLINTLKLSELECLMNDKEQFEKYIKQSDNAINLYQIINAGLHLLADELMCPKENKQKNILGQFEVLDEDAKRQVSIDLYNNKDFQDNLCAIVLDVVKQNVPEAFGIMNLLGFDFEKYMREAIISGKGYKAYIPVKEAE